MKTPTLNQLSKLLKTWKVRLRLNDWTISLHLDDHMPMSGVCEANWEYLTACITVNPVRIDDAADLEEVLVHELCHVLLDGVWQIADTQVEANRLIHERTTEELCHVLLDAWRRT